MAAALIALGSNLGDRQRNLDNAIAQLAAQPGIHIVAKSRWHATRPVGGPSGQGEFLNGAALVETTLSPEQLHAALKQIETAAGRNRAERWAPRTLDLDLLLYEELVIETPELSVPHPRMAFRRFVLEPAAEIAPAMRHPTIGWTIEELRDHIRGRSPYVAAIAGPIAADKSALASAAAAALAGRVISDPEPMDIDLSTNIFRWDRPSYKRALELLELRARPIRMTAWASNSFMMISDYWFRESAIQMIPAENCAEYFEHVAEHASWTAEPKLLVALESPDVPSWFGEAAFRIPNWFETLLLSSGGSRFELTDVKRKYGPILKLDTRKPNEARDELVAAIQSMQ